MPESKLTQRQKIIFKTIVEEFTRVAEPVGSKTLMQLLDFPVSSATIRNEMAVLEKAGLLEKTHTSSGRIPSQKGYRFYVEHLMETHLDVSTRNSLQQVFRERHYSLDEVVEKSCDILSHMTNLTSIVLGPDARHQALQHIQVIPINENNQTILMVTHSIKAASHAQRVLFIKDGVVFHQIYRGDKSMDEMYQNISDTLTVLATGGARNE